MTTIHPSVDSSTNEAATNIPALDSPISTLHGPSAEKLSSAVRYNSAASLDDKQDCSVASSSDRWRPSIFRIRPLFGIASLGVAFVCLFVSLGVLLGSHGAPSQSWRLRPSVYLAITTALSNTALNCALAQAAPISWWYKVLRGSTVRDLELQWEASQSLPRAIVRGLRQGRCLNMLTIASLAVALVVVDGPLLQRSSYIHLSTLSSNVTLQLDLAPELPTGFSGWWVQPGISEISDVVNVIRKAYEDRFPISSNAYCNGTCSTTVRAPGVAKTDCSSQSWPITNSTLRSPNSTWGSGTYSGVKPFLFSDFFVFGVPETGPDFQGPGLEKEKLIVGKIDYTNCTGAYVETNCTLVSAILEYNIELTGHQITFPSSLSSARVVAYANNTFVNTSSPLPQPGTIDPLFVYLQSIIRMNATYSTNLPDGALDWPDSSSMNAMSDQYVITAGPDCEVKLKDPTDDIIALSNELMFCGGILAGSWHNTSHLLDAGLSDKQTVHAYEKIRENVFNSDLRWFAGAAALQLITMMLILPIFWGWWKLGVELTLSPFQVARMFDAPLFRDINSAAGASGIVKAVGDRKVKLGKIEVHNGANISAGTGTRLGIAESHGAVAPAKGMRFTD